MRAMVARLSCARLAPRVNAASRSTTCRRVAPAAANRAATSQGARSYTLALSRRPCSRRTAAPSSRSIAGKTSIGVARLRSNRVRLPTVDTRAREASGARSAQQGQPRRLALFGVELAGEHVVARDRRAEVARRAGSTARRPRGAPASGSSCARSRSSAPSGVARGGAGRRRRPARASGSSPCAGSSGRASSAKRRTRPGRTPRPARVRVLLAALEQQLHADADARRTACPRGSRSSTAWRSAPPPRSSPAAQAPNAPWPGTTSLSARATASASALIDDAGARPPPAPSRRCAGCRCPGRRRRRAGRAHAVSVPLVDGTPDHARVAPHRRARSPARTP